MEDVASAAAAAASGRPQGIIQHGAGCGLQMQDVWVSELALLAVTKLWNAAFMFSIVFSFALGLEISRSPIALCSPSLCRQCQ